MNSSRDYEISAIKGSLAIAAGLIVFGTSAWAQDAWDHTSLEAIVRAEANEYIRLRNAMLDGRTQPWDVTNAAKQSWEAGLAAFVLNQRLAAPAAFARWDKLHPRPDIRGVSYRVYDEAKVNSLEADRRAATAFLLEKMWKAPGEQEDRRWAATHEQESKAAYESLIRGLSGTLKGTAVTAMWKAIWEQSEDDRFRYVALRPVCADPDPSVQPIILEVLLHPDPAEHPYAKSRCLGGLWYRDTEETVDAILGALDILTKARRLSDAVGALAVNGSPRARRFVHEFILNPENDETLRGEALAKCCNRPHPDDVEIIRQFMAGPASVRVKTKALSSIGSHCPFKHVRLVFREILIQSDDREMIASAASALNSAYGLAKHADPNAKSDDAALLENVLQRRNDLGNATRIHIEMYIQGLRAQPGDPRPRLPDTEPNG